MQNEKQAPKRLHDTLTDPATVKLALAAFAASVMVSGCSPSGNRSTSARCPENPSAAQAQGMTDQQLRECVEAADREGHSSYSSYHGYYIGRGFSYSRGSYTPSSSGGSAFSSGSGTKSGSSYKSGGGSFFGKGGSSSGGSSIT